MSLVGWVRAVRRRRVVVAVCAAALAATALNEAIRWATVAAIRLSGREILVLDVGPFFLAALVPFLVRRWSTAAAARLADSRLGLSDRLASFVDFASRADVPGDVRAAQARETSRALAGIPPAAAAPLRAWLAAGPLLLLVSLAYPMFVFTGRETVTMTVVRRIGCALHLPGAGGDPASAGGGPEVAASPRSVADKSGTTTDRSAEQQRPKQTATAPGPETAKDAGAGGGGGAGDSGPGGGASGGPGTSPPSAGNLEEGEQQGLPSERVRGRLAPVVDPLYTPAPAVPQPPTAAGTISIDLVPKQGADGTRGSGDAPGRAEAPERVLVDLDALPERYRPLVKTYFELLAGVSPAGGGTTTDPARSGRP